MTDYDIIVVGAGNAGLSAAATAVQYRMKTLLIDRNPVPGGCATSFRRGRFEFEPSLHELAGVGTEENPGSTRKLFSDYGIRINWKLEKNAFRVIAAGENGYDITMPAGVDAFCAKMEEVCPGSAQRVRKVFDLAHRAGEMLGNMMRGRPCDDPDLMKMLGHPVDECLRALGVPEKARQILDTYWVYLGTPADELNFLHYAVMLDMYINGSPAMPPMRSHELSLALDHVIRQKGGDVFYGCEVTEFLTENGQVCGVRLSDGREFRANAVLSTTFPEQAMARMLPPEMIPEKAKRLASARKTAVALFTVYLGLNRSREELGIRDYSVFIAGNPDSREQFDHQEDPEDSVFIANCLNVVVPDASPEGTCELCFTMMLPGDYSMPEDPAAYRKWKNSLAERMIRVYEERTGVSISEFIEEIVISSPATFARYLGTPGGTPYGYHLQQWDNMATRLLTAREEQFIPGLTFIGAAAERGDGYSSTYINGHSAAGGAVIAARLAAREAKRNG